MANLLLAAGDPLSHVVQHIHLAINRDGGFFSFPLISNHIIMQLIAAGLLCWMVPKLVLARAGTDGILRLVPRGASTAIETVCVALREHIFRPNLGRFTDLFTPYLWSTFFFVLTCNMLGMIPIADWLGWSPLGHVLGGTSTGNIWVTATLAGCTLFLMIYNGLRFNGIAYVQHFFIGPWWLSWFIAILEVLGLAFKAVALAIRLFANMVAGHVLLAALLGFVDQAYRGSGMGLALPIAVLVYAGSVAIYFLEIFVAFLHAFIFTVLTAVFIGQSVNIHHDDHDHHDEQAPGAHGHAHEHGHGHGGAAAHASH